MEQPNVARERRDRFVNSRQQSLGSVGPFVLMVEGRPMRFEFHGVCGPVTLDSNDEPLKRQPGSRSPFYPAFDAWRKAGCYVDRDGVAYIPSQRIMGSRA